MLSGNAGSPRGKNTPMSGHIQNRRKQLVVNRPLQSKLILNIALYPALALAVIAIFTAVYCTRLMDEAMAADTDMPNLMPLFYLVISFELLAGIFLLGNSLKVSHKVAGPAYRICKSLERMRSGDLAFTVNLRKGDHLTEIRDELNKVLDWLNENPPAGCVTRQMKATEEQAVAVAAPIASTTANEPVGAGSANERV